VTICEGGGKAMAGFVIDGGMKQLPAAGSVHSLNSRNGVGGSGSDNTDAGTGIGANSQKGRVKHFLALRKDTERTNPDLYDPLAAFLGVSMNELGRAMLSSDVQGLVPVRSKSPAPIRSFRLSREYGGSFSLAGHAAH
jgi:hypothetical protein